MQNPDPYYQRAELSNSDLSWLELQFSTKDFQRDATEAYRFGSLIDCMITEKERVDFFKRTLDAEIFNKEEFEVAKAMKKSFFRDQMCSMMAAKSTGQMVFVKDKFRIEHRGFSFDLAARIKYDLFMPDLGWGGDIKSTTATTQDQFVAAIHYFKYTRQRAFYMDISGADKDVLIGISKVKPHKVFKVFIDRDSALYKKGKEQYEELAFQWWYLFNDFGN